MTAEEKNKEGTGDVILPFKGNDCIDTAAAKALLDVKYLKKEHKVPTLNYNNPNSAFCIDAIVQHEDLMSARERIKKEKDNGASVRDKILASKKVTAGHLVKAGTHRIGMTVFDVIHERQNLNRVKIRKSVEKKRKDLEEAYKKADAVLQKKGNSPDNWTGDDLKDILRPMKKDGDPAMPTLKAPLRELYDKWMSENRQRRPLPPVAPLPPTETMPDYLMEDDDDDELQLIAEAAEV